MAEGWDGKEKRTTAPTAQLRRNYRWNRFRDGLAENGVGIAAMVFVFFSLLGVIAAGISAIHRDGEKTRALIQCIVQSFAEPDRETARIALAECIRVRD